ncbi:MAG: hypothetical protein SFX19_07140 [Alphaproteobacteria bacterium]|nr:hypothetical protein [Alphaproteobacteria bacterium]
MSAGKFIHQVVGSDESNRDVLRGIYEGIAKLLECQAPPANLSA